MTLSQVAAYLLEAVLVIERILFGLVTVGNTGDVLGAGAGAGPFDFAETSVQAKEFTLGVRDGSVGGWEVGDAVVGLLL